ncbi:putative bifunctional diguanylate cyclase/phosphodiesterase [Mycobacterium sp. 94-17]|uniref:putative bifunctional diguanylate cyclase/phosphodiesterase n=1 Tax=Mycobacterium sp. 94-17 TaxID=2986147 RepID=UPI002D1EA41F|nr:EAL domain-containing protein [Mycobacterium sp. 94-17]MEB4210058.1 EAL domain-containing protein [Mycobacterium sp. 94-17]
MSGSLDDLVTSVAAALMAADASNSAAISQRILGDLVGHFGVDAGFLRRNDHEIHATVLVAEWPARNLDPDPIGVVYFADADSVFKLIEKNREPYILRPEPTNADYQQNIAEGTGVAAVSLACVPMLSGDLTTGTLGFVKYGDREWLPEELNALQTIATLFAQLQARMAAEEQVRYLAEHDDLTGLLNRRALITHLDKRLAEGRPGPVAILFLDLDRFKVVNEHLGQSAGDRFIKGFADLLREAAEGSSVTARLGGDELVVVPSAPMDTESAVAFAKWLQDRVHKQVVIDGEKLSRSVTVGVVTGMPGSDTTSDLLRRADQATRSAKSSGGARVAAFSPEMSEQDTIRNDIELELEGTTDSYNGALVLHYLPEFDMRTGEVLGAEALIRWQHPTRGLLMPESFIGVLESINLARKLGRLVMRSACLQFGLWRSRGVGADATLRVNISPMQLVANNIVSDVAATLNEFAIDPKAVCLEITERVVVQEIDTTRRTLAQLKDIGVQIAIDDFGTGYSALAYLKSLPVDTLKIDKGFVLDLGSSTHDLAIVQAIVALADAFKLEVVAEGVETVAAAKTLVELGCSRAQGFLLSRPLDSAAMESLLAKGAISMDFSAMRDVPFDA